MDRLGEAVGVLVEARADRALELLRDGARRAARAVILITLIVVLVWKMVDLVVTGAVGAVTTSVGADREWLASLLVGTSLLVVLVLVVLVGRSVLQSSRSRDRWRRHRERMARLGVEADAAPRPAGEE